MLIFYTDDQRKETLSVMPKMRRWFKKRGTTFSNGFATTPLCCPARATLFTGQYAHNHGVRNNNDAELMDADTTLQRYLRDAGYRTALAGKYLNRWDVAVDPPHFDRFAMLRHAKGDAYFNSTFNVDGKVRTVRKYSTAFIGKKAVEFLRSFDQEADEDPWLMYVTVFAPHGPATPERRYRDARVPGWKPTPADREADRSDKPPFVQEQNRSFSKARDLRRRQLRSLMSVDDVVDRVMKELRELNEGKETIAFFLSDNGMLWREHKWERGKRVAYLPAIRIPFFARWPGHIPAGTVDKRIVANADVAPTVLEVTGVAPGHEMDGRSLFSGPARDRMFIEFYEDGGVPPWASTWTPEYQYVEWYADDAETVEFTEYYELAPDPWQLLNLLGDPDPENDPAPETLAQIAQRLADDRECQGTSGPKACP